VTSASVMSLNNASVTDNHAGGTLTQGTIAELSLASGTIAGSAGTLTTETGGVHVP